MSTGVGAANTTGLSLREWLQRYFANPATSHWEFVFRTSMYVPISMRRRCVDGTWEHRDATEDEIRRYMEAQAW